MVMMSLLIVLSALFNNEYIVKRYLISALAAYILSSKVDSMGVMFFLPDFISSKSIISDEES
jgi:hypothetical protein